MCLIIAAETITTPSPEALQTACETLIEGGARSLLILATHADHWQADAINPILKQIAVPIAGGVFPSVLANHTVMDSGTVIVGLADDVNVIVLDKLATHPSPLASRLRVHADAIQQAASLICIADCLSDQVEPFLDHLYNMTGAKRKTAGCGAGNLAFEALPCLFTNAGLIQDAIQLICVPTATDLGVTHGYDVLAGPFFVTAATNTTVESLNFQPAFEVYRHHVEQHSTERFATTDFFDLAKTYPLGIESLDGDILVRDPFQTDQSNLTCIGEVPVNSTIYLLHGTPNNLIESAGNAAQIALEQHQQRTTAQAQAATSALVFDCISRALFLGPDFEVELEQLQKALKPAQYIFGALSLGEIASTPFGPVNLLNKSTVVAVF